MTQGNYYLQFMDQALEMVLVFDGEGKIVFANRRAIELLEYTDILRGVLISDVYPEVFSHEKGVLTWDKQMSGVVSEQMAYRQNRTCFSVNLKICPINETDGLMACMALDVSRQSYFERKASLADAQMENAEQIKNQFVANVTHELRTPVNGILGNVYQLEREETDPAKQTILRLMERGCKDMHSIINNILDFSKLDAGKLELERKEFNFRELMEYVQSNHIHKIAEKGLDFFMNISPDVPERIIGDELRIGQILNNFLSNATKFTAVGKITVEVVKTAQLGNRVELFFMVIDTGIGIDKQQQDKLFKSFSQVEASTTRKYGGTGLGLNISKQLVEMMGGNVHVESEKNKGSMFSFHIWVDVPADEAVHSDGEMHSYEVELPKFESLEENRKAYEFGTEENRVEIQKKLSKLILCVEMKNWEKAEMFTEALKELTVGGSQPVKSAMLRLKMSVQKADYEKVFAAYEAFEQLFK